MPNRVGDPLPSEAQSQAWAQSVNDLSKSLEPFVLDLSSDERLRMPKLRGGSKDVAELIARLLEERGVSLPESSPEDMRADLVLAARIGPLRDALERLVRTLDDTILAAEGEAWGAAMMGYSALLRMSPADAKLANDLAPARALFKTGRRRTSSEPKAPTEPA
ncbi:MAG: hypothetical protein HYV07_10310 [Deltaproteobacteria bacterium]|nr:hypothetical protein [Deltaproteobacteria bacterium]